MTKCSSEPLRLCKWRELVAKMADLFLLSAALLLFATGTAKLIGSFGNARLLDMKDPVFWFLSFRWFFRLAAVLEISIAMVLLLSKQRTAKCWLAAWLSTIFLGYRGALLLIGYKAPCACLGRVTNWLPGSQTVWQHALTVVFLYLLFISYAFGLLQVVLDKERTVIRSI